MDLTTKTKLDLIDAHLWAETARFHVSCQIRNIPEFFSLASDIKIVIHPHGDESDDLDYYVTLEFVPVTMVQGRTQAKLAKLLSISYIHAGVIQLTLDETSARLDGEGNIVESWTNERPI